MKKKANLPIISIVISIFALVFSAISVYLSYKQYDLKEYEFHEERLPIWEGEIDNKTSFLKLITSNNNITIDSIFLDYYDPNINVSTIPYRRQMNSDSNEVPLFLLKKFLLENINYKDMLYGEIPYLIIISTYYYYKGIRRYDNSLYTITFTYTGKKLIYNRLNFEERLKKMNRIQKVKFLEKQFDRHIFKVYMNRDTTNDNK